MFIRAKLCQRELGLACVALLLGCGGATEVYSPEASGGNKAGGSGGHGAVASGGLAQAGGVPGSGGRAGKGGSVGSGGTLVTGGVPGSGGTLVTGGVPGSGGSGAFCGTPMPQRAFCNSNAECGAMEHCDLKSCVSSSCQCFNGQLVCTTDCRHVCAPGAGGAGGQGGGGGASSLVPLGASSWNVMLAVSAQGGNGSFPHQCEQLEFTMRAEPDAAKGELLTMGVDGRYSESVLEYDGVYRARAAFTPALAPSCDGLSMSLPDFTLEALDTDFDGKPDEVRGSGSGSADLLRGDYIQTFKVQVELAGGPDQTNPKVTVADIAHHPLDEIIVNASEPLAKDAAFTLKGDTVLALTPTPGQRAPIRFTSNVTLPFSGKWPLAGSAVDLVGLTASISGVLQTLQDPGLFAQDGFEGSVVGLLSAGAKRVTAIGSLPALNGSASLFLPSHEAVTFLLRRDSAAKHVRFSARALLASESLGIQPLAAVAGVVGGTKRASTPANAEGAGSAPALTKTGDTTWPFAAPSLAYDLTLEESGADVVVRIMTSWCQGLCPTQALLIDDLRVE